MMSAVLTVEQLAERWDVNPRTIRKAIDRGEIKAMRVGRIIRISRSHVEHLEQAGQRHTAP